MKNVLAVCDVEKEYACHFMEYLNQRRKLPFEIQVFTSVGALTEYGKNRHIELLLISEYAMCDEVKKIDAGRIVVLSDGSGQTVYEDTYPSVCKYQGAGQVVREVLDCYGAWKQAACAETVPSVGRKAIVFCSAGDEIRKTEAALAAAEVLSENGRTLYLNLERCSGFEEVTGESYEKTLSDLLFYYRREKSRIAYRLDGLVRNIGKLCYVPPAENFEDIDALGAEGWADLIREVLRTGEYETLILDVEKQMICQDPLAQLCRKICVVTGEGELSLARSGALIREIRAHLPPEDAEKICLIKTGEGLREGADLFSGTDSGLAKRMRKIFAEDDCE